jgi:hypothetical protein
MPAQDAKARAPRRCLFCGRGRLTREHAWPEWLLRALGILGPNGKPLLPGTMQAHFGPDEKLHSWPGPEIKPKHFCKGCNEGWMSVLEGHAKPIIKPILADLTVPLDGSQQHILARWSIKTAIVFEATGPRDWPSLFTEADRALVADPNATSLPPGTMVWLGRHAESNVMFAGGRRLLQPVTIGATRGPSPIEAGYATTLGFARLVIQVLRIKFREDSAVKSVTLHPKPGPWESLLTQIWPPRRAAVQWPPAASFSETGTTLDDLNERYGRGSV